MRPVPEQECCLAYLPPAPDATPPRHAALHGLNLTTWLVLTLCDGRDESAIAQGFSDAVGNTCGAGASRAAFHAALGQLHALGLVQKTKGDIT
ncbi:hypothetical protein DYH55_09925 [Methylovirgula sp. 4M-Z18]|nr:hypothetical protein DYH55_09925 [Methylovirgula sp. 4M-Z18]